MASRLQRIAGIVVALALAALPGLAQYGASAEASAAAKESVESGRTALTRGDVERARAAFERGLEAARQRRDRAAEADLLFYLGLTGQRQAAEAKEPEERRRLLEASARSYTGALEAKSGLEAPLGPTLNNVARVYADLGWKDAARDALEQALSVKDDPRRPLYAKSYAGLIAETGSWRDAATWYRTAVEGWPDDAEAHEALVTLYRERAPAELPGYLWWLVERGQVDRAQAAALQALAAGGLSEEVGAWLLGVVAGTLAEQYGAPGEFRGSAAWKALAPLASQEQVGPGVRELARLYATGELSPEAFPWWRGHRSTPPGGGLSPGQAFRQLAVAIGRWHERTGKQDGLALAERYFRFANDLGGEPDPVAFFELADLYIQTGRPAELQKLSEASPNLFQGKGEAYLRGDWQAIFDFHRALGLVYGTLGRWGDTSTPASAIFQLERARQAAEEYNRTRPRGAEPLTVPPALVGLLAKGYQETGREGEAQSVRTAAAAEYRRTGDERAAEMVLTSWGPELAPLDRRERPVRPDKPRVAVLKFEHLSQTGPSFSYDAQTVQEQLVAELIKSGNAVVERQRLETVMQEQGLSATGPLDPTAVGRIGEFLGADYLLLGTVNEYGLTKPGTGTYGMGSRDGDFVADVSVRLIDVATGQLVWSDRARATVPKRELVGYGGVSDDQVRDKVIKPLVEELAAGVEGRVH